jgi:hypothetical protein
VPEPVRQTQGTLIYAIEGKDKAGRRATFDVVVAKKEFLWVRKSSEEIEKDGKTIPGADIASQVLDADVKAALGTAREIIAVGTASREGDAKEETARAGRRAKKTAEIVVGGVAPTVPIWTLNSRPVSRAGKRQRSGRHKLAAPVHGHCGQGSRGRRQHRRSAVRRLEQPEEAPGADELFGVRAHEVQVSNRFPRRPFSRPSPFTLHPSTGSG